LGRGWGGAMRGEAMSAGAVWFAAVSWDDGLEGVGLGAGLGAA
jgi:hypothetical protein